MESQPPTFWLTPQCEQVQNELMELAASIEEAATGDCLALKTTFLLALSEFRQRLRDHAATMQGRLFDDVTQSDARYVPTVEALCQQHQQLDALLQILERQLNDPRMAPASCVQALCRSACELAELVRCHHGTADELQAVAAAIPPARDERTPRGETGGH